MSQFINNPEHAFGFDTLQLHVGQESADPASDSRAVPIYQTTSYVFRNSQHAADRFGLADAGNIYGRLTNSTQGVFEDRIAALEGGVAGLAVASGAAAITYTLQALAQAGDHVVAQKTIYGGSYNLLEHTLSQFGVETTFVDAHNLDEVEGAIKDNTTVIYLETLGNPNSDIPRAGAKSDAALPSDFMIHDASYLRLKNVTLAYTFDLRKKCSWLRDLTLSVSGENLYLWKKYNGFDPDVSSEGTSSTLRRMDLGAYPKPRTIIFSIQLRY